MTLYEGQAQTSVPLFTLSSSKLSVPVSLSYTYNGYKPGEEASTVGLGWNLQATGVITRIVRGRNDFYGIDASFNKYRWDEFSKVGSMVNVAAYMDAIGKGKGDSEPDLFIFNFMGHSGKFILVGGIPILLPQQDLHITWSGTYFTIIAEDGTTYYFGKHTSTSGPVIEETTTGQETYTSAWYLTQIVSADTKDHIDFIYQGWKYTPIRSNVTEMSEFNDQNENYNVYDVSVPTQTINSIRISNIQCVNGSLAFSYEKLRTDLTQTTGQEGYALTKIELSNASQKIIKTAKFEQQYFGAEGYADASQLKLTKVMLTGNYLNKLQSKSYQFKYNSGDNNFPKVTKSIDRFGYYNGASNYILFDHVPSNDDGYVAANRNPSDKCANGLLTKIIFPTGGYETLEYEPNYFPESSTIQYVHDPKTVGGSATVNHPVTGEFFLNEPQTITIDYEKNDDSKVQYNIVKICQPYGNSLLESVNECTNVFESKPLAEGSSTTGTWDVFLGTGTYFYTITCAYPQTSVTANIGYYSLEVINNSQLPRGPGMRVAHVKFYDQLNSVNPAITKDYSYPNGCSPANTSTKTDDLSQRDFTVKHYEYNDAHQLEFKYNFYTSAADYSYPAKSIVSYQYFMPSVRETSTSSGQTLRTDYFFNSLGSEQNLEIKLIEKDDYIYNSNSANFTKLNKVENDYQNIPLGTFFGMNVSKTSEAPDKALYYTNDPSPQKEIFSADDMYELAPAYSRLNETRQTQYDKNGDSLKQITTYYYDNPNQLQATSIETQNSKQQTKKILYKYPHDFQLGCSSMMSILGYFNSIRDNNYETAKQSLANGYNSLLACGSGSTIDVGYNSSFYMIQHNIFNIPVEVTQTVKKNGETYLINSIEKDYPDGLDLSHVYSTYYPKNILLSDFTANPGAYYTSIPAVTYNYSSQNNINQQYLDNDVTYNYIWGYNQSRVIAQTIVTIAPQNGSLPKPCIYYTSFEDNDNGNWSYTGSPFIPGTPPPTGSKALRLYQNSISTTTSLKLKQSETYILSYWTTQSFAYQVTGTIANSVTKITDKNGWNFFQHKITGVQSIVITGSNLIDEVRLYPDGAQMTTYTYDPLIGVTSQSDINNTITYYEYDGFGRLALIRDLNRNIIKKYNYTYYNQIYKPNFFISNMQTQTFAKNDCTQTDYSGSEVADTVMVGSFTSDTSQRQADSLAIDYLRANGQANANVNGTCLPKLSILLANYHRIAGFTITLTPVYDSTKIYTLVFPETADTAFSLQKIPQGRYNITIAKTNNSDSYVFTVSGANNELQINSSQASWLNIPIRTGDFDKISINTQ